MRALILIASLLWVAPALALQPACNAGVVFEDLDGDGRRDRGEPGLPGIAVSDGLRIVRTGTDGRYRLPVEEGRTVFLVKPAGWRVPARANGLPDFWRHLVTRAGPVLRYGGLKPGKAGCRDFALQRDARAAGELRTLVFGDPQPKSATAVGYYERDIIESVLARRDAGPDAHLGLSLGDIVDDDLSLYPAMNRATARLGLPWLHAPGNHDLDFDAARDEDSLHSFRHSFGPDTLAWEEHEASFVVLDNVIYRPGQGPAYIGGLRDDQFVFLEAYLATLPRDRLLVLAAHIPFFDPEPGRETFRRADRERLFTLLAPFPHLLLLTAHGHVQRHHLHGTADGWHGAKPLHEYNVGAACGGYWGGPKDARGLPDARMADGTPNGWAVLTARRDGSYGLRWEPAGPQPGPAIGLHAPEVLRRGAYPAVGVYANVYMALPDARVEYRIGEGEWRPMAKVAAADPALRAENLLDDATPALRGYDRLPEATVSTHLWRGTLPTDLPAGKHSIEVRTFDPWRGELSAGSDYRLEAVAE